MLSWHDDLNVGAETLAQLTSVKEHMTLALASLPAGPLELHNSAILPATSRKVQVLGYQIQPGRGHVKRPDGSRSTHVKPGAKRIRRYMSRLHDRLASAPPDTDLLQVGESYHGQWFRAQQAWTKVPEASLLLSQNINLTYIWDFEHGIAMGGGKVG